MTMDYEKAYKKALERARIWKDKSGMPKDKQGILDDIFPELEESEDERIRKAIIQHFKTTTDAVIGHSICNIPIEKILAWLEKQDIFSKKDVDDAYLKGVRDTKNEIEKQYEANYQIRKDIATFIFNYRGDIKDRAKWMDYLGIKVSFVEMQGEQKSADKVEPKFHEGEWVTNGDYTWKIVEVKPLDYILQSQDGNVVDDTISHVDEQFHSFTIEDAKDGDVLADKYRNVGVYQGDKNAVTWNSYCYCGVNKRFYSEGCHEFPCYPATKEQRDQLEKAMADARYTFDFEKKKLRKIEQKPTDEEMKELLRTEYEKGRADAIAEMQVAWSEEDETTLGWLCTFLNIYGHEFYEGNEENVIDWLKSFKSRIQLQQEWSEEDETTINNLVWAISNDCIRPQDREDYCDWLKSLKDRYSWKPSDKQREALEHFVRSIGESGYASPYDNNTKLLYSLLSDLKKLKGE